MDDAQGAHALPVALWLDGFLRRLTQIGISYYVSSRGNSDRGTIVLHLCDRQGQETLLVQTGARDTREGWQVLRENMSEKNPENDIQSVISRMQTRDPDLWVVAIDCALNDLPLS